jgi:hypothetical protein
MATYHVSQSGAGSANGTSEANAWAVSAFNTAGNWSSTVGTSGKISPGDTVILYGTISSSMTVQGSGASGNRITILFAENAKLSAASWESNPASNTSGGALVIHTKSHLNIDGGTNGIIECTDNGTNLGVQNSSKGINGTSVSDTTIRNLTIRNIYVRVVGTDLAGGGPAIQNTCKNGNPITNFIVEDCLIHDAGTGIDTDYAAGCSNYTFRRNTIYNVNWGGRTADRNSSSAIEDVYIYGNRIYNFSNWDGTDTTSRAALHHNGWYCWAESGGSLGSVFFYGNTVGPGWNTQTDDSQATAGLFISGAGAAGPFYAFNNVFISGDDAHDKPSNGHIYTWPGASAEAYYLNNTSIGKGSGIALSFLAARGTEGSQVLVVKNNLIVGATAVAINSEAGVTATIDRNLLYSPPTNQAYTTSVNSSSNFRTFAQWQALGYDTNGIYGSDPLLTETYRLGASSPAIGEGENLSAYFTTDADGNTRPASGAWDIGAFQYAAISPPAARGRKRRGAKLLSFFR